jgi:hypothetical protein
MGSAQLPPGLVVAVAVEVVVPLALETLEAAEQAEHLQEGLVKEGLVEVLDLIQVMPRQVAPEMLATRLAEAAEAVAVAAQQQATQVLHKVEEQTVLQDKF